MEANNMQIWSAPSIGRDNGTKFTDWRFEDFCIELGITQLISLVEHPQANGLAEVANKVILTGLRKRLEKAKGQ